MKILLCGFMGAGKSTLLQKLRSAPDGVQMPIIDDLDELISTQFAPSSENLGDYIQQVGWETFRENERSVCEQWLAAKFAAGILALGGGTLEHHSELILNALSEQVILVWLDTPFDLCLKRIRAETHRPLAQLSDEQLKELYLQRCVDYSLADCRLGLMEQEQIFSVQQLQQQLQNTCKK